MGASGLEDHLQETSSLWGEKSFCTKEELVAMRVLTSRLSSELDTSRLAIASISSDS